MNAAIGAGYTMDQIAAHGRWASWAVFDYIRPGFGKAENGLAPRVPVHTRVTAELAELLSR